MEEMKKKRQERYHNCHLLKAFESLLTKSYKKLNQQNNSQLSVHCSTESKLMCFVNMKLFI